MKKVIHTNPFLSAGGRAGFKLGTLLQLLKVSKFNARHFAF